MLSTQQVRQVPTTPGTSRVVLLMTITDYSDRRKAKSAQGTGAAAGAPSVSQGHVHGL